MSSNSGSSCSSPTSGNLPTSSYDGSHLHWRSFRAEVLTAHGIRVLETPPKDRFPESFLQAIEVASLDAARSDHEKVSFWDQVTAGHGFGPSPVFPPHLLPTIDNEPRLARCMVPSFVRDALPERTVDHMGPLYEISIPHPGLGCGFAPAAFTNKELATMPQWLQASGTVVNFETGYISAGVTMYCTYLTFERAYGNKEHRVETANNNCAIGGAFTARSLQMLYIKAWKGHMMPELPVSFSCTIDNSFAVLNFHWIDQGQTYCMAPMCQFDLSKDEHFNKFLVWTQAIGDWSLKHTLPLIKEALHRLQVSDTIPTATKINHSIGLKIDTGANKNDLLLSSLRTSFKNVPWKFDDNDECTPGSSSTASWGSPMVTETTFSKLNYPQVHPPRSTLSAASFARRRWNIPDRTPVESLPAPKQPLPLPLLLPAPQPPPAEPTAAAAATTATARQTHDIVWQKRLESAMNEIQQLQHQIQALRSDLKTPGGSLNEMLGSASLSSSTVVVVVIISTVTYITITDTETGIYYYY